MVLANVSHACACTVFGVRHKIRFVSDLCVNDNSIERVHGFKLLRVGISKIPKIFVKFLKWNNYVDAVCARASSRLHLFKNFEA